MPAPQSPFIGHRVQLVQDGKPILYNRYRDVAEILVVSGCGVSVRNLNMLCHHAWAWGWPHAFNWLPSLTCGAVAAARVRCCSRATAARRTVSVRAAALLLQLAHGLTVLTLSPWRLPLPSTLLHVDDRSLAGAGAKRPAEAAAAAPAANGHAQQANGDAQPPASKKRKQGAKQQDAKPQPQQQQPQPQPQPQQPPLDDDDAHAPEPEQQPLSRKELKKLKKQQRRQQGQQQQQQQQQGGGDADAAGTNAGADQQQQQQQQPDEGNAAEAARLRQVLGFTGGGAAQPAAAAAVAAAAAAKPAAAASGSGAFTFNFSALPAGGAADGDADAAAGDDDSARVAAATEAKLAAISAVTTADKDGYVPRRVRGCVCGGVPRCWCEAGAGTVSGHCGGAAVLHGSTRRHTPAAARPHCITTTTQRPAGVCGRHALQLRPGGH
jgi:hypothetical protein